MFRFHSGIVFAAVLGIAGALTPNHATAADQLAESMPAAGFNWTGVYVGAGGGYNWTDVDNYVPAVPAAGTSKSSPDSYTFGGLIGYRYQIDQIVIGAEGDYYWLDGSEYAAFPGASNQGFRNNTSWTASVRGTLGYAQDRWLVYATGGWSWLGLDGCGVIPASSSACFTAADYDETAQGWTAGAGIDYAVTDNIVFGVEYRHADYDSFTFYGLGINGGMAEASSSSDAVLARLIWKFGG